MTAVIPGNRRVPARLRGAAIGLGVMDGVHLGHQAVVADARAIAEQTGVRLAAAVFEPHPRHHFQPDAPPFRIQSAGQRVRALAAVGVEAVFELAFGPAMAALTKDEFARDELVGRLGVTHVSVGFDFRYGRGRKGDVESLRAEGAALGFGVSVVAPFMREGEKVSSTAIRACIAEGRMQDAALLLSRPWAIEGAVVRGDQRGRALGFPTANMALGDYVRPRFGIYAARADLGDGSLRAGVASCGVRPMYPSPDPLLEIHVLDFDGDLYGRRIEVQLIGFLRPEARFDSAEALTAQMAEDAAAARAMLR
jgi:riboflavin kinase/FMN adenylyltransferase